MRGRLRAVLAGVGVTMVAVASMVAALVSDLIQPGWVNREAMLLGMLSVVFLGVGLYVLSFGFAGSAGTGDADAPEAELARIAELLRDAGLRMSAVRVAVDDRRMQAAQLADQVSQRESVISISAEQAQRIGRFLGESQEKRSARQLWIGVLAGAMVSVPIGVLVNLLVP